jgi:hypothetical protein
MSLLMHSEPPYAPRLKLSLCNPHAAGDDEDFTGKNCQQKTPTVQSSWQLHRQNMRGCADTTEQSTQLDG